MNGTTIAANKPKRKRPVDRTFSKAFANYKPPADLTVSQWAAKHRVLSRENSAEAGPWRNERTPYLTEIMDAFTDPKIKKLSLVASSQVGKALAIDTPIPIPGGWATMEQLKRGDKVFDEKGNVCNVTAVTVIMHNRKCYVVEFSDGSRITADACHKWYIESDTAIEYPNGKNRKAIYNGVLTTQEIAESFKYNNSDNKTRHRYAVPTNGPLNTSKAHFLLPPYTLGVWLGDGNSYSAQVTTSKGDYEIIKNIRNDGVPVLVREKSRNVYNVMLMPMELKPKGETGHSLLTQLGVLRNKHIPAEYLRGSYEQRLSLLQGIMDTDGTISKAGRCEITLKSKQLIDDVSELLHTLGIKHTVKEKKAVCTNASRDYKATVYRISFMAYDDKPVFRLKRKLDRMASRKGLGPNGKPRRTTETDRRRIVNVVEVDSVPVKCISVDSPSRLYLAGKSMIPTHNSELELNIIGYIIDEDPGSILYIQPTIEDAKKFSRLRIAPMIRDSKTLRSKVADVKSRDSGNTMLQKSFPGGMLTIVGSNSASGLASTPAKYVIGDERDRWALSAGTEGDPWGLAEARTTTFYNAKMVDVSTPTIKDHSPIERSYNEGTQEVWCHQCPECGEWHNIEFNNVKFEFETIKRGRKKDYIIKTIHWVCPSCGCVSTEDTMRKQPAKWIAKDEEKAQAALKRGHRSFWLNAFSSPWQSWEKVIYKFLVSKNDPQQLKVVYNTMFGWLWEDRGELPDDDEMLARREDYGKREDGSLIDLPDGVLVLTCGVDTQDNRLEYEVVGHGHYGETWGIKKGIIMGDPHYSEVWQRLDDVIDKVYRFKEPERGLKISMTFVDSGGHKTQDVYRECAKRLNKRVFAIKGQGGDGVPYTKPPSKVKIVFNGKAIGKAWLYVLGVDAGKTDIMNNVQVQQPGAKYCHFPKDETLGYDSTFFNGLISEKLEMKSERGRTRWVWVTMLGHERNEALDCRNYALAAFRVLDPDLDAVERRLKSEGKGEQKPKAQVKKPRKKTMKNKAVGGEW